MLANFLELEDFSYDSSDEIKVEAIEEINKNYSHNIKDFENSKKNKIPQGLELISPIRAIDSDMIVRRASALHQNENIDQAFAYINPKTMLKENLIDDQKIKVSSEEAEITIKIKSDEKVSLNSILIFGKQLSTASLGMNHKLKIKRSS